MFSYLKNVNRQWMSQNKGLLPVDTISQDTTLQFSFRKESCIATSVLFIIFLIC